MRRHRPHRHALSRPLSHGDCRSPNPGPDANIAAALSNAYTHPDRRPDSHRHTPLPNTVA